MPGTDVGSLVRSGVASMCLAAGVLHMSAAADHRGMATHVAFFVVVAVAQSAVAAAVLWGKPGPWLAVAAAGNLAVAVVWALSRTTGLPVDGSSAAEAIGFKDGITTMLELGVVTGALMWWLLPESARHELLPSRRLARAMLGTGVWALSASGLFAGHTHSAGHSHDGGGHAHAAAYPHATAAHPAPGHEHGPDPVSGDQPAGDRSHVHGPVETALHDHHATGAAPPVTAGAPGPPHTHVHGPRAAAPHVGHDDAGHQHDAGSRQVAGSAPAPSGDDHDHGAGGHHDGGHHDGGHHHDPDRGRSEEGRKDEGGASALDAVLKLIRPSSGGTPT